MTLDIIWYVVVVLALICYAMLDGFDLGVGLIHLFAKSDTHRRIFLNSIGPVWDGNEVWLVVVAGGLFAGFPDAFATIFSTFYIPVIILLMGLMFRAVSIEFRSKHDSKRWRSGWDAIFAGGSFVISFGIGLVMGNLIQGIPLDESHNFIGTFVDFVHPYAILVGLTTVALFAMHGAIFLVMKTTKNLHDQLRSLVPKLIAAFFSLFVLVTAATLYDKKYMIAPMLKYPILFLIPVGAFVSIFSVPLLMRRRKDGWAFLFSCLTIALLLSLSAIGTYPYMVRSSIEPATHSLTLFASAASPLTLKVLLIIAAIGLPMVFGYGFYVYRTFRGKVEDLDHTSY